MVAYARRKLLGDERQAVFHCWTRCVRRAFLCGRDPVTARTSPTAATGSWSAKNNWPACSPSTSSSGPNSAITSISSSARSREWPAAAPGGRPPLADHHQDRQVLQDELPEPDPKRVEKLARDKQLVQKLRRKLSSISWFMGILCENIARRANAEDGCRGRFWETRYNVANAPTLMPSCCADLRRSESVPSRRGGQSRGSRFASVFQRLQAQGMRKNAADRPDGWLGELTLQPESKADEALATFAHGPSCVGPGHPADLAGGLRQAAEVDRPATEEWPARHDSAGPGRGAGPLPGAAGQVAGDGGEYETAFGHAVAVPNRWSRWPSGWNCSI